ncbi:MAG: thiamine phosphate synthase [Nitrospirae bacterium]|nr:thiamine phosphate synthase [Nitrospirota bacterium]
MQINGIYFITDRTYCSLSACEMVSLVLKAGVRLIQYRDKDGTRRQLYKEAVRLRELTRSFGAMLIMNDHADIALAVKADGVHLGQDDLPLKEARKIMSGKIVGISTHSLEQARDAEAGGADYIGFGPVFQTATKDAGKPKGVDNIRLIKQNVCIPVVAIGGITIDTIGEVIRAGADAAAVASAICRGSIENNARQFVEELKDMLKT